MKNKLKIGDEIKVVDIENSPEWLNKKVKIICLLMLVCVCF